MRKQLRGSAILLFASLIWGMAFSAQSTASEYMAPFAFTAVRSLVTSFVLFLFLMFTGRLVEKGEGEKSFSKHMLLGSILGILLFGATGLQQAGIGHTTAAKSGFITALYIVIVPILGALVGHRPSKWVWIGVISSLAGLYMLCIKEGFSIGVGDLLTLGCAFVFSLHILTVDKYAQGYDAAKLCCIQFCVSGILAGIAMLLFEGADLSGARSCIWSILYVGVFSGAVGYTLQITGQRDTDPTVASLVMCMESVFAALGGWLILGQSMLPKEIFGCLLMLLGSVLALLPEKSVSKPR